MTDCWNLPNKFGWLFLWGPDGRPSRQVGPMSKYPNGVGLTLLLGPLRPIYLRPKKHPVWWKFCWNVQILEKSPWSLLFLFKQLLSHRFHQVLGTVCVHSLIWSQYHLIQTLQAILELPNLSTSPSASGIMWWKMISNNLKLGVRLLIQLAFHWAYIVLTH